MGLGHFLDSAGKALGNVAKGAEFVANHPGKVIEGAGKVAEYTLEHPGQVAKIAGKELVHSLTDPKELAINAALIVGTAGAGFAAKEAATIGARTGIKVAGEVVAETAGKVAAETAGKAVAETATKAVGETAAKAVGESAAEAGGRSLEQKVLETGRRNPISRMVTNQRTGAAERFLAAGGENPSALRQAGAAAIQGTGGTAPARLEGMSDAAYSLQKTAWRGKQINTRVNQAGGLGNATEVAAHPVEAALRSSAMKSPSAQTPVSQPGTEMQPYQQPGAMQPLSQPANNSYTPGRGFTPPPTPPGPPTASGSASADDWDRVLKPQSQQLATLQQQVATNNQRLFGGPSVASAYPGMAGSSNGPTSSANSTPASRVGRPMSATDHARSFLNRRMAVNSGGLRAWQGPHREMFGGIDPNYDWRKGYENRPQKQPRWGRFGKPEEAEQPGAYDTPSGQEPLGALNPGAPKMTALGTGDRRELGAGPRVHFGEPGARPMGPATDMGGRKASFYSGAQKNVLDADSMSPDDYKFEPGGQGYLDFPDMPRAPLSQPSKRPKAILGV